MKNIEKAVIKSKSISLKEIEDHKKYFDEAFNTDMQVEITAGIDIVKVSFY